MRSLRLLTPRIIGALLLFGCIFTYLMKKLARTSPRVTHSPRELNSWREKESVARPLTTREMSSLLPSLVYQELTACGCAQKQRDLQGNRDR